jgi:REP element-mobilizing transposase RayT
MAQGRGTPNPPALSRGSLGSFLLSTGNSFAPATAPGYAAAKRFSGQEASSSAGVAMLLVPYRADELRFAFCYHTYLRWCTHRLRSYPALAQLDRTALQQLVERFSIHVLECQSEPKGARVLVSLQPQESVSACASKLKGQTSKWLREALGYDQPQTLLSKGYFASTCGKSERSQVESYLSGQGDHHGYSERTIPPVYVESFPPSPAGHQRLQSAHAFTVVQFHLVLATWHRRGVFAASEARAVAWRWRALESELAFTLLKVSFLPDHVHVAVQLHPRVAPAEVIVALMNAAQQLLWDSFPDAVIQAGVERLWQPSAYLGSFGDLATPKIQRYLRNWTDAEEKEGSEGEEKGDAAL